MIVCPFVYPGSRSFNLEVSESNKYDYGWSSCHSRDWSRVLYSVSWSTSRFGWGRRVMS